MTTFPIALGQPDVPQRRYGQGTAALSATDIVRRVLNATLAMVALVVALPLLVIIAIAVKLSSPGPVFYTQTRVGVNRRRLLPRGARYRAADCGGKPFTIFKFRTMRVNGETKGPDEPGQVWATPDDPRVTRVGRILRLYRLDELPQLVNVLLGDMDIVGPRPEQPAIFTQLREQIPGYQERQEVRPGITGWAQINQHYDSSIDDVRRKLAFDLEYLDRRSLAEDLRIMWRTLPVIAGKFGAW
ncbi:MAG TPA: sugar transferase [Gemmatimonadales bacterium]|nr:sugar transferase [Gemmatimonadales bacterium]